jgi:hypothetical protein
VERSPASWESLSWVSSPSGFSDGATSPQCVWTLVQTFELFMGINRFFSSAHISLFALPCRPILLLSSTVRSCEIRELRIAVAQFLQPFASSP